MTYGPVPRYGHQTQPWQQPDPANVRSWSQQSGPPAWTERPAWAGAQPPAPPWMAAGPPARPDRDPGQVMGIVGLVLAFVFSLIGLACCVGAVIRSHRAGYVNVPAIIGIPVAVLTMIISAVFGPTISAMIADCLVPGSGIYVPGAPAATCPVRP
ncbi:hypothetical protein [Microlunatus sp. GCM10028923]|uniref:hypothetical protein n=1 Tax=Microlunatus sp. GCM10028923 TaxID=3273400 RepID=UPI0036246041